MQTFFITLVSLMYWSACIEFQNWFAQKLFIHCILNLGAVHGVLHGQALALCQSVECFMTASWSWGQGMEYFVTSPLALCQVRSALWLHLEVEGSAWSTSWPAPWHCAKVRSALWLHLEVEGSAWSTSWPAPWHCAKCGVLYDCILKLRAVQGVLRDQPLGTVPSAECFMTASWSWGQCMEYFVTSPLALCQVRSALWLHLEVEGSARSTSWPVPWHCAKCGVLYDCILKLRAVHGVLRDQPLGTVPSAECFMTASWSWGQCMEYFVTSPLALCQVRSAYDCILKLRAVHGVLRDQPLALCQVRSALWLLRAVHGVLRDQPLGTVPSAECFMTASWSWGQCMEYFVTSPLALCQVRSALWLHLEFEGSAWCTS